MDNTPLRYIPEPDHAFIPVFSEPPKPPTASGWRRKVLLCVGALVVLVLLAIHLHLAAPNNFPVESVLTVESGETMGGIARTLEEQSVIKSPIAFKVFMVLFGGTRGLDAGDYYLETSEDVATIAWRLSHGKYNLKNIRITVPEGFNHREIAEVFSREKRFTHFDKKEFIAKAAPYEGYLFPDTYLFLPGITAQGVIDAMLLNYQKRIETLRGELFVFGRDIKDVINMASIIEEEARTKETREIIAGILWKRLDERMPLQVDAAFEFVNGKNDTKELTLDDLKIDSPYNTYVYKGLPPTPIANPGINAIRATIHPVKTKYYFYLSDDEGNMHYAITHDEHVENKNRYLR